MSGDWKRTSRQFVKQARGAAPLALFLSRPGSVSELTRDRVLMAMGGGRRFTATVIYG